MRSHNAWCLCILPAIPLVCAAATPPKDPARVQQETPTERTVFQHTLDEARRLIVDGAYDQAEILARKLIPDVESRYGPESVEVARVLDVLAETMWRGGKSGEPESRKFAERAVRIKEDALGPEHPEVAQSLRIFGILLLVTGDYAEAKPVFERALAIREKTLGPDHPDVAQSLNNLANLYWETGNYIEARPLFERALRIREMALGPDHPDVAASLNNLANLFADMGEFVAARPFLERALAIEEKVLPPDHPDLAQILNSLAAVLSDIGDYSGARPFYERALRIREMALGADHPDVAASLNNLGNLLKDMGDLVTARPLLERASAIREKALGPEHPLVAQSLTNLAELFRDIGDYAGAKPLYERALATFERSLGPEHSLAGGSLDGLAILSWETGDYGGAKSLYERALSIREKALGPEHPALAPTLNNLAVLLQDMGDNIGARPLYERALTIREKSLGPDHPLIAIILDNLAVLAAASGEYPRGKALLERSVAIQEKALGRDHPKLAHSLNNLANLLADIGEYTAATDAALRAEEIGREHFRLTARTLPERQALRYVSVRGAGLDLALSMADASDRASNEGEKVLNSLVHSRALVLDEMGGRRRALSVTNEPDVARLTQKLVSISSRLANLWIRGAGTDPPELYRKLLEEAQREKEQVEQVLAERSAAFREDLAKQRLGLHEVGQSLPQKSALVSFAYYRHYSFPTLAKESPSETSRTGSKSPPADKPIPSYLAFVLRDGAKEPVTFPLGTAEEIDAMVSRWQKEAARPVPTAGSWAEAAEADYRVAGESLRRKIWDRVALHLGKAKRVFIVPDGALNLVNLSALPIGRHRYLVEDSPVIHYLSAERDLVQFARQEIRGNGLLAMGGPAFDETSMFATLAGKKESPQPGDSAEPIAMRTFRGERSGCPSFQSVQFDLLPASAHEVRDVASLWKAGPVVLLTGTQADETAFKQKAPGRQLLHLATHGFFLGRGCESALAGLRGIGGLAPAKEKTPAPLTGENPLLLSGLALAGANHRAAASPEEEDGILTAEEIAAMDLSGVEWAVLSACDTGVGEVRAGEGVFGLRRAFQVAGTRTLIMSLWSVEDKAARQWMRALYEGRLIRRLDSAQAVREASLNVLRERRQKGETTHPFYWAAFVAAGDWK